MFRNNRYHPIPLYHYVKIYLTYRWMCGKKCGCTNFIAHNLACKVANTLVRTGLRSSGQVIGLMSERYNEYLLENRSNSLEPDEFDRIYDTYTEIVDQTFYYLAKHRNMVDDLLQKKPKLLNANMKQFWNLFKERTYTDEQIIHMMNLNKIAFDAIKHGMFVRLLIIYEKLPEFGSNDD